MPNMIARAKKLTQNDGAAVLLCRLVFLCGDGVEVRKSYAELMEETTSSFKQVKTRIALLKKKQLIGCKQKLVDNRNINAYTVKADVLEYLNTGAVSDGLWAAVKGELHV